MLSPEAVLDSILIGYVEEVAKLKQSLVGCIQFGSTVRGALKRETDIDLYLIFETLPDSRFERSSIVAEIEAKCLRELEKKLPTDYNLYFSSLLKTSAESLNFSLLYLDMVDHSKILFDSNGFAAALIDKTRKWIQESGAHRVEKGLKWYWVLGDVLWEKEQKIGW